MNEPNPVITGIGAVSAAGLGADALEQALLDAHPLFGDVRFFDPSPYPAKRAALCPPEIDRKTDARGRGWRFLLHASLEALASAGLARDRFHGPDTAVILGTTLGGMEILPELIAQPGDPRAAFILPYHAASDALGDLLSASDASTISGACASSLMAVGEAAARIRAGACTRVLAGGFDAFCEFVHAGFCSLLALDPDTLRPFDVRRRGLLIGEGAGMVLVEDRERAEAEGRTALAGIAGYAAFSDANHITGPHPDGDGLFRTLEAAWEETGLTKGAIDAVHAHGTGTIYNDRMEGIALERFLEGAEVPVTASKGVIGHTLGAAGGLETVACVQMLRDGFVPPAGGFEGPDPECRIRPVTGVRRGAVKVVVKSAAGFGGQNAALVLKRGF